MQIDFKKICWEQVEVPDGEEELALEIIKSNNPGNANAIMTEKFHLWKWENLTEGEIFLSPKENNNEPTVEVWVDHKIVYSNSNKKQDE